LLQETSNKKTKSLLAKHIVTLRVICLKTEREVPHFVGSNVEHLDYYLISTFVAPLNL
jgi:hypothetical protein